MIVACDVADVGQPDFTLDDVRDQWAEPEVDPEGERGRRRPGAGWPRMRSARPTRRTCTCIRSGWGGGSDRRCCGGPRRGGSEATRCGSSSPVATRRRRSCSRGTGTPSRTGTGGWCATSTDRPSRRGSPTASRCGRSGRASTTARCTRWCSRRSRRSRGTSTHVRPVACAVDRELELRCALVAHRGGRRLGGRRVAVGAVGVGGDGAGSASWRWRRNGAAAGWGGRCC